MLRQLCLDVPVWMHSSVCHTTAPTTLSIGCPFALVMKAWSVASDCRGLGTAVTWVTSPVVLGALIILLLFCLVVLQSRVHKFRRGLHRLREDFTGYRRDVQTKVKKWTCTHWCNLCHRACIRSNVLQVPSPLFSSML